jgi:two-component system, OmpR family, phosphate regulon sensor histidine kinase PhoR
MKTKWIRIIILSTFVALTGVIITQSSWMFSALKLRQELFTQNVNLGIKSVANQIMLLQTERDSAFRCPKALANYSPHKKFITGLEPSLVDSMMTVEFRNLSISECYYYGIYEILTGEFVLSNDTEYHEQILNSANHTTISCVFQEDQFMLAVYFPLQKRIILSQMQVNIILSAFFTLIIIAGFWFIIKVLLKQKKISQMKSDFVNNMTHEFKTPIATISVASEMLMNEKIHSVPEKALEYARIIYDENRRLKEQVEHVLQVAMLDKSDFQIKFSLIDAHPIIADVMAKFEMTIKNRNGTFHTRLNAANSMILADKNHLINVVQNLVDNAIKYSPENPQITLSTRSSATGFSFVVEDNGIGIEPNNQQLIFEQFHRIPTGDVHDVKGFGIGLFYVKKIVEAHGGSVSVTSRPGAGSSFTVFIPFETEE